MLIPVKSVTVALPPKISIVETMMFVASPKNKKTIWASLPHLARMISRKLEYTHQLAALVLSTSDLRMSVGSVLLDLGGDHGEKQNLNGEGESRCLTALALFSELPEHTLHL